MSGFEPFSELMDDLGKYSTGVSCLYLKRLAAVDLNLLEDLVAKSVDRTKRTNS